MQKATVLTTLLSITALSSFPQVAVAAEPTAQSIIGSITVHIPSQNHFNIFVGYLLIPSDVVLNVLPDPGCTITGRLVNLNPQGWYGFVPRFSHFVIGTHQAGVHEGILDGTYSCGSGGNVGSGGSNTWDGKIKDVVCTTTWTWDQCPAEYRKQNANYSPPAQVNGCGSDASGNFPHIAPGGADFGPACSSHDIGYSTCNSDKSQVDFKFLFDMLAACGGVTDPNLKQDCEVVARGYYIAVDIGGESAYHEAQIAACVCCKP